MKIVVDKNIPFIRKPLEGLGEIAYLKGDAVTPEIMSDTDILLTRTRTRCDAGLLDGSRCSFIGTATIGTDHIDLDYCRMKGIKVVNAPGCNAPAVAQYVLSAVKATLHESESFADKTLGIIGVGHVGSIVARWAESLGMKVLLNDPPKFGDSAPGVTLETIARECDIITIHTPLTRSGDNPTFHLLGKDFLSRLKRRPLLINSARGGVMDTTAVKEAVSLGLVSAIAVDCWENEPAIDTALLEMAAIATPHIAGYSYEGKVRATSMVLDALASHLRPKNVAPAPLGIPLQPVPETITADMLGYDIMADTVALKSAAAASGSVEEFASAFESLRNNYNLRHEPGQNTPA